MPVRMAMAAYASTVMARPMTALVIMLRAFFTASSLPAAATMRKPAITIMTTATAATMLSRYVTMRTTKLPTLLSGSGLQMVVLEPLMVHGTDDCGDVVWPTIALLLVPPDDVAVPVTEASTHSFVLPHVRPVPQVATPPQLGLVVDHSMAVPVHRSQLAQHRLTGVAPNHTPSQKHSKD